MLEALIRVLPRTVVTCPGCQATYLWYVTGAVFDCPFCGSQLRFSASYLRVIYLIGWFIALLLVSAAGWRGDSVFSAGLVVLVPVLLVVLWVNLRLIPPDVEFLRIGDPLLPFDLVREETEQRLGDEWSAPEETPAPPSVDDRRMFRPVERPFSLEGAVIATGIVALLLYHVYVAVMPLVAGVTRRSDDERVSAERGNYAVLVHNPTTGPLTCHASFWLRGYGWRDATIDPGGTVEFRYAEFATEDPSLNTDEKRAAGSKGVAITCTDEQGLTKPVPTH